MKKTYIEDYEKSLKKFENDMNDIYNTMKEAAEDIDDPEAGVELANLAKETLYQSTVTFLLPKIAGYLAHICDKLDALEEEKIEVRGEMDEYERRRTNDNNTKISED